MVTVLGFQKERTVAIRTSLQEPLCAPSMSIANIHSGAFGEPMTERITRAVDAVNRIGAEAGTSRGPKFQEFFRAMEKEIRTGTGIRAGPFPSELLLNLIGFSMVGLTPDSFILPFQGPRDPYSLDAVRHITDVLPDAEAFCSYMANVKTGMFSSKKFPLLFDSDEVKLLALSVFRAFGMEAYLTEFKIDLSLLSNLGIDLSHFATATEPLNVPTYTMLEGNLHLGLTVKTPDDEGVLTFVPNMGHPPINGFTLLADHEVNCILHALRAKRQILLMQFSGDETRFEKALEDVNTSLEDYHTNPTAFAVLAHIFDFAISAVVRQGFPNVLLSDMSNQLGFRDSLIAKTRTRPEDLESVLNLVGAIGMGNLVTGNHQLTRLEAAYLISIGSFYGTVG